MGMSRKRYKDIFTLRFSQVIFYYFTHHHMNFIHTSSTLCQLFMVRGIPTILQGRNEVETLGNEMTRYYSLVPYGI